MSKYIFRYKKEGIAKYISHLDFLRAVNRAFRRAEIFVVHSQGFNPHPLLSFAMPLALGITSECEAFEAVLEGDYSPEELTKTLNSCLPDGIEIISSFKTEQKNWFGDIAKATYIVVPENMPQKEQIALFLAQDEIIMEKKTKKGIKPVDIKQDIYDMQTDGDKLILTISAGNERSIKPTLVTDALNKYTDSFDTGFCTYHRSCIFDKAGKLL